MDERVPLNITTDLLSILLQGEKKKGTTGVTGCDQNHDFKDSGPKNLVADWKDSHYRISAVACLVQGVYVLEGDRRYREEDPRLRWFWFPSRYHRERDGLSPNLAPDWWESLSFQHPTEILVDEEDQSIFGAIYKFESQLSNNESAPTYVISFRGTILKLKTGWKDLKVNTRILLGTLHESSRYRQAMKAVEKVRSRSIGAAKFWLAGHSQGAAIALLVEKEMAKKKCFIETYLFNPPNVGPSECLKNPKLKFLTRLSGSFIKAGVAFALQGHHRMPQDDQCVELSGWTPFLFVNPDDYICSKYIADLEFKKMMVELGLGNLVMFAMRNSIKTQCLRAMDEDSIPFHFIPSASLNINSTASRSLKEAHEIQQWWSSDLDCQTITYQCSLETTDEGR